MVCLTVVVVCSVNCSLSITYNVPHVCPSAFGASFEFSVSILSWAVGGGN